MRGLHVERHSGTSPDLKTDIDKEKYPKKCTHTPENKSGIATHRATKLASERVTGTQKCTNTKRLWGQVRYPLIYSTEMD